MTTVVNGKQVTNPHALFELGSKTYLMEATEWQGSKRIHISTIWEPRDSPGQLMRAKNPIVLPMDGEDGFMDFHVLMEAFTEVISEAYGVAMSDVVLEVAE